MRIERCQHVREQVVGKRGPHQDSIDLFRFSEGGKTTAQNNREIYEVRYKYLDRGKHTVKSENVLGSSHASVGDAICRRMQVLSLRAPMWF